MLQGRLEKVNCFADANVKSCSSLLHEDSVLTTDLRTNCILAGFTHFLQVDLRNFFILTLETGTRWRVGKSQKSRRARASTLQIGWELTSGEHGSACQIIETFGQGKFDPRWTAKRRRRRTRGELAKNSRVRKT